MRKYLRNKKMITLTVSVLATTLILTGTFAWSVRLFSTTGGLGVDYNYLVKLLDIDTEPLFVLNNWDKEDTLDKKVYATSSYKVEDIAKQYDEIMDDRPDSIFRDTWVRIKLEETFMRNGSTSTTTIKEMQGDTLKSSISDGKYFTFDTVVDTEIILLSDWNGNHGRFWILDEDTGWLYWAQPLLATTVVDGSNPELVDQTTDHIIDEVELKLQPAGVWEYTIKATLEAMDVELQGYKEEGAWDDIDETHNIYPLFADDVVAINATNFPDETFRTWITSNVAGASDKFLTPSEIDAITNLDLSNQGYEYLNLKGVEYFTKLQRLDVSENQLLHLDVTSLTQIDKSDELAFIYNPQFQPDGVTPSLQTNYSENIKEWAQYDELGNLLFNEYNFPDIEFRNYLKNTVGTAVNNWDPSYIKVDNKISQDDLKKVTKIDVHEWNIIDLKGIEHFVNLDEVYAYTAATLKSIDVSNNKLLTYLNVRSTSVESLDLRNNTQLKKLFAHDNPNLVSLELGSKQYLTSLFVYNCQLSSLDISGLTAAFKTNSEFIYYEQYKDVNIPTFKTLKATVTGTTTLMEWE